MKKRTPKFVVFQDMVGQWRWHLKSSNGRILCQGESHPSKSNAMRAIRGARDASTIAVIVMG